jgi:peptidoglycan/LPS O-acetylase OafA/YrhL
MSDRSYFDHLASVRGLAALVVLFSHLVQIHFLRFFGLDTPVHVASSVASEYAVVVFFILSGYLIAHSLEGNIERHGRLRLGVYMAARIARLYPPMLFAVALSLSVYLCMGWFEMPGRDGPLRLAGDLYSARDQVHIRAGEVVGALLMLQGMLDINGPLWSLYMEAKLYILFACALAFQLGRRSILLVSVLLLIGWAGLRFNPEFSRYAIIWLVGCFAYYTWDGAGRAGARNRRLMCAWLIGGIAISELVLVSGASELRLTVMRLVSDTAVAGGISWLLFKYRIDLPVDKRLADCSYSLYATHFPVLLLFQSWLISVGSSSLAATFCVALTSVLVSGLVALAGGEIEAKKDQIQKWTLAGMAEGMQMVQRIRGRLHRQPK